MCEVCEAQKRCDLLNEEIEFRILQYQKERNFGNLRAQKEARQLAMSALEEIFIELDKVPELEAKIKAEQEQGSFTKKPPQTH